MALKFSKSYTNPTASKEPVSGVNLRKYDASMAVVEKINKLGLSIAGLRDEEKLGEIQASQAESKLKGLESQMKAAIGTLGGRRKVSTQKKRSHTRKTHRRIR